MLDGLLKAMHGIIMGIRRRSKGEHFTTIRVYTMTQLNLDAPLIWRTWLNNIDSTPSVSSKFLIEDEEANQTTTPKFHLFIPPLFNDVEHSQMFRLIELIRHLDPWISRFLPLLNSFSHKGSVWNQDFVERFREFAAWTLDYCFFQNTEWKALIQR